MPNQPSQVVRDLNLNSGDAVELHIAADILRMAEGVSVSPGISPDVNRADAGLDSINRSDGLLDTVNRDGSLGVSVLRSEDFMDGMDSTDLLDADTGLAETHSFLETEDRAAHPRQTKGKEWFRKGVRGGKKGSSAAPKSRPTSGRGPSYQDWLEMYGPPAGTPRRMPPRRPARPIYPNYWDDWDPGYY